MPGPFCFRRQARLRASAISKLFCMRIRVSIDTPNAFSMRSAISGDSEARSVITCPPTVSVRAEALPCVS